MELDVHLTAVEARVLGALLEKEITTPEYYPLSLNALINACNQKSNRDPVMNLDEDAVRDALHGLEEKGLAGAVSSTESRVTKYGHRLQETFNFGRRESAVICVLLLRGAQTPGELRGRTERMYRFDDLAAIESTLQRLMEWEPPLVKRLPRQPGTKESRYAHLLSGDVAAPAEAAPEREAAVPPLDVAADERIERLENDVAALQQEVAGLKEQFAAFQKQFE